MIGRAKLKLRRFLHERRRAGALQEPFGTTVQRRVLLLAVDHPIPQSQLYGFHHYARAFREIWDAEFREISVKGDLDAELLEQATTICIQTHFDISDDALSALVAQIEAHNPAARRVYLDWFAPTDLRLAERMNPIVDAYVSKHVLRDRSQYGEPTFGDTTLMDHYGRAHGLDHETQEFLIPNGFLEKLHVGPSFLTADFMLPRFARGRMPLGPRPADLHARLAVGGSPWYSAMRAGCADAVAGLEGVRAVTGTGIGHARFLRELRASKTCFSPFGYGEVCWRDYEAILCGATLIKQDMSHVETAPDIFIPNETYVPVKWDMSDFEPCVRDLLADSSRRKRIARNAFEVLHDYARSGAFVAQMAPALFGEEAP